jgi:hypothetical protein
MPTLNFLEMKSDTQLRVPTKLFSELSPQTFFCFVLLYAT